MDKIVCLGKNYLDHVLEMKDSVPEKPVIFIKPRSILRAAIQGEELKLFYPPDDSGELHYETEIVLRLDKGGYKLDLKEAERACSSMIARQPEIHTFE
ncbi:MAG: fumarylacetoacetate hydrolase family protein, partial [Silvanigrellaceae bacterium]|nr:fumarylacetoacetate hydrolase family protein [Silvanigrellaceae bacterium]